MMVINIAIHHVFYTVRGALCIAKITNHSVGVLIDEQDINTTKIKENTYFMAQNYTFVE